MTESKSKPHRLWFTFGGIDIGSIAGICNDVIFSNIKKHGNWELIPLRTHVNQNHLNIAQAALGLYAPTEFINIGKLTVRLNAIYSILENNLHISSFII